MKTIIWESVVKRTNGKPIIIIESNGKSYAVKQCDYKGNEYKTLDIFNNQWDAENHAITRTLGYTHD